MNKLMIALAIAAMAVASQAASVDWQCTANPNFKGYNGGKLTTTMPVYLIDSAKISTIEAAIKAGTLSASTDGVLASDNFENSTGKITKWTVSNDALTYDKGTTKYDFAMLIIDDFNGKPDKYYNISQAINKAAYDPTKTSEFAATAVSFTSANFTAANSQTGGWVKAVPEPTSGLLLLLGVAGMALRRRRA